MSEIFFCSNSKKNAKVDKDGNENVLTISKKAKLIDSARFITTSTDLVGNLIEEIHKAKCKNCDSFLEFLNMKVLR